MFSYFQFRLFIYSKNLLPVQYCTQPLTTIFLPSPSLPPSPQQDFFELMTHGKWCVADPSAVMVAAGRPFEAVILLHQGTASAYVGGTASPGDKVQNRKTRNASLLL